MKQLKSNSISEKWMCQPGAGIDVSQNRLHLCILPLGDITSHGNDREGIAEMVRLLESVPRLGLIVVEATGGYEKPVVTKLHTAGLPIACVNPRQARDLAKGLGVLAKNDRVDGRVLARCAQLGVFRVSSHQGARHQQLRALNTRRNQLVKSRGLERTRLKQAIEPQIRKWIQSLIAMLTRQLAAVSAKIQTLLEKDAVVVRRQQILESYVGIGRATSQELLCSMPELGSLNRRQAASLLGTAPWDDQSGDKDRPRKTWGGRKRTRCQLYICAISAIRWNPVIREFYTRLTGAGKPGKVAIIACVRKMIVTLNSMLKNDELWSNPIPEKA